MSWTIILPWHVRRPFSVTLFFLPINGCEILLWRIQNAKLLSLKTSCEKYLEKKVMNHFKNMLKNVINITLTRKAKLIAAHWNDKYAKKHLRLWWHLACNRTNFGQFFLPLSRKTSTFQKYKSMLISICHYQMEKQMSKVNNKYTKRPLLLS